MENHIPTSRCSLKALANHKPSPYGGFVIRLEQLLAVQAVLYITGIPPPTRINVACAFCRVEIHKL